MHESKKGRGRAGGLYGVLDSLVGSSTELRILDTLLRADWFPCHRKWLIDNSQIDEMPTRAGLAQLVELMGRHQAKLRGLAVAWVTREPCGLSRRVLERGLPFQFRRFDDVAVADRWLRSKP